LREEGVYANVIQVTSPDRLYEGWGDYVRGNGTTPPPYLHALIPPQERHPVVSVIDGHPLTLQWIGEALGVPQVPLGVTQFGESGDIASLYRANGMHADDIVAAVGRLILDGVRGRDATGPRAAGPAGRQG
jgi:pyruvate dehydrogenase E1 component